MPFNNTSLTTHLRAAAKTLAKACRYLVYPPRCIHCQNPAVDEGRDLCQACSSLISLIDPANRCQHCVKEIDPGKRLCADCSRSPNLLTAVASACDYEGPMISLICALKYGNQPRLAKSIAALMAAQLLSLDWPLPDMIVPVPISWMRRLDRGYNQCELLAEELSLFLDRPVATPLRRRCGDWSQAGLTHEQRATLTGKNFYLAKDTVLYDKTILLVDDVLTTGSTLKCCSQIIADAYPEKIFALTATRAH